MHNAIMFSEGANQFSAIAQGVTGKLKVNYVLILSDRRMDATTREWKLTGRGVALSVEYHLGMWGTLFGQLGRQQIIRSLTDEIKYVAGSTLYNEVRTELEPGERAQHNPLPQLRLGNR